MVEVSFIEHGGTVHTLRVEAGASAMRAAIDNGVPGIEAICGGGCSCATCHVYVDAGWVSKLDAPGPDEVSLLEFVLEPKPESRLSCQIKLTRAVSGIVLRLPESQS